MNPAKVNLFLVGAMKAGTTTFAEVLGSQDEIYLSPIKEPHFFVKELPKILYEPSKFFSLEKYFRNKFPESLHIGHVKKEEDYKMLFSLCKNETYRLDASTMYLHAPETAEKIYKYNPEARILIIKRDPVSRSYSHYRMLHALGREPRSFQEVIEDEIVLYHNNQLPWYSILGMSFYKESISRYMELFESVMVISLENLIKNKEQCNHEIAKFLDINSFEWNDIEMKNRSRAIKFTKLFYFLKRLGVKDYFSAIFRKKFKRWVFELISKNEPSIIDLTPEVISELDNIFKIEST